MSGILLFGTEQSMNGWEALVYLGLIGFAAFSVWVFFRKP